MADRRQDPLLEISAADRGCNGGIENSLWKARLLINETAQCCLKPWGCDVMEVLNRSVAIVKDNVACLILKRYIRRLFLEATCVKFSVDTEAS